MARPVHELVLHVAAEKRCGLAANCEGAPVHFLYRMKQTQPAGAH